MSNRASPGAAPSLVYVLKQLSREWQAAWKLGDGAEDVDWVKKYSDLAIWTRAGEINDLYTTNIRIKGARIRAAFLLKGNGLKNKVMRIADCGKNGDQHLRLFDSPAELFVIQFVGNVDENLIRDVQAKVEHARLKGKFAWYCVINGQDTARLLMAYGKA